MRDRDRGSQSEGLRPTGTLRAAVAPSMPPSAVPSPPHGRGDGARATASPERATDGRSQSAPRRNQRRRSGPDDSPRTCATSGRAAADADHVFRDGRLRDLHSECQQLAVDSGCAPARIGLRQGPNQCAEVCRDGRSAGALATLPCPEHAEASAMPRDDGLRFDDDERLSPTGSRTRQPSPEPAVRFHES